MGRDAATRLFEAFVGEDPAAAIAVVEKVKGDGVEQAQLFDSLFAPAMSLLGGAWAAGEIDEYAFTQAAVVAEQIASFVAPPVATQDTGITIVIGGMHRDLHSIDKNTIAAALKEAGHRVIDLGVDVRPAEFVDRVEESSARIVVVTANMTSTARSVAGVRDLLVSEGHEEVMILVNGGPFSADAALARAVGANGVVRGAESSLRLVARIVRDRLSEGD